MGIQEARRAEARLGETPFAVLDVETTGFHAKGSDRIVEIGIVRMDSSGRVEDEYVTLLNPDRDVGPTDIHGVRASDVINAPRFVEVAGDIAVRLSDAFDKPVRSHRALPLATSAFPARCVPVDDATCGKQSKSELACKSLAAADG